jgi:hypothetical protein
MCDEITPQCKQRGCKLIISIRVDDYCDEQSSKKNIQLNHKIIALCYLQQ